MPVKFCFKKSLHTYVWLAHCSQAISCHSQQNWHTHDKHVISATCLLWGLILRLTKLDNSLTLVLIIMKEKNTWDSSDWWIWEFHVLCWKVNCSLLTYWILHIRYVKQKKIFNLEIAKYKGVSLKILLSTLLKPNLM